MIQSTGVRLRTSILGTCAAYMVYLLSDGLWYHRIARYFPNCTGVNLEGTTNFVGHNHTATFT